MDDYLAAVRRRDCEAFTAVVFTAGTSDEAVCERIFRPTRALADRLKEDPTAKPRYQGGNSTYGFFTVETRNPTPANSTISVIEATDADSLYVVLDVAASPTAEQQRRTIEALKRSRKEDPGPERSPSRKAR